MSLTLVPALGTLFLCWVVVPNFGMRVLASSYYLLFLSCLVFIIRSLLFKMRDRKGVNTEGRGGKVECNWKE